MTADQSISMIGSGRPGDGIVMEVDRTKEFRSAGRRTALVRTLRIAFPLTAVALLGVYALSIVQTAGLVGQETLSGISIRKILPEDLAMKNPRYEGFNKDGGSYVFTAKTAQQDLTIPGVVTLNDITGEVYQPDKTRTDITAKRGIFNNEKNLLDLYEQINVDSQSGLKARLTRATILTKEDLLTSEEPVLVEFPNGSVRSKRMTLRQKAREATFAEEVAVVLTPPADSNKSVPVEGAPAAAEGGTLFTPSSGPINIAAQRLDISDTDKTALFTGNVRAEQAGSTMTTPELQVIYEGEGMMGGSAEPKPATGAASPAGKLKRIIAKAPVVMQRENGDVVTSESADFDALAETAVLVGNVVMTSGTDRRAVGRRVEINEADGTIALIGDVTITQGGNELRGGHLAINRTAGTARLTRPPEATAGPGRISARLLRSGDGNGTATKAAAGSSQGAGAFGSFRTDPNAPVNLTSDSLDVDDTRKVAVFRGEVNAEQDSFKIQCAELSAFYSGQAGLVEAANPGASKNGGAAAELTRIEARRNVHVTASDGQKATGDWADFDAKANRIVMGGNVVLSKGKNMVRGTRLVIDMTTGESKIDTAPQNTVAAPKGGGWTTNAPAEAAPASKGRASAVFFPEEMQEKKGGASKGKAKAPSNTDSVDGWSATAAPDGSAGGPAN
ncbi:LPS export ABC transporter periplasmic protein LptC [Hyphomicrobium sp. CS1GBMeth3]|uniref:LPS export ABC transporter periplasmic protein LptC n=1 Tax=Hyphomicrobium sp. CS1GBMeth3 TaxID=1892845 RepID=UPI0015C562C1|nr:LPS export ABC transporter periplasmic protein LptC [Hyphomicrobium sp. CS1GBMeth3]